MKTYLASERMDRVVGMELEDEGRRDFLKDCAKVLGGVAVGYFGSGAVYHGIKKLAESGNLRPEDFEWGDERLIQKGDSASKLAAEADWKYFKGKFDIGELANVIETNYNIKKHIIPDAVKMKIPIRYKK
jgi:hypothetical protein